MIHSRSLPVASPISTSPPATAQPSDDRVFNRIAWRLMPLLIAAYVLNYLDRNNLGFAPLQMNEDLGLRHPARQAA